MPTHEEMEEKRPKSMLDALGQFLDKVALPDVYGRRMGFALVMFEFGTDAGQIDYISNTDRKDMIIGMKEFIANAEGMSAPVPETPQ